MLGKDCDPANKENLLITKYYVKSLIQYDEHNQILEPKNAFTNLKTAEKLDRTVLITKHGWKKETIRIQMKKMQEFRSFMTV